ncbi:MAG: hypothetical protein AAFM91_14515 [Pseudomonadota bacterium]
MSGFATDICRWAVSAALLLLLMVPLSPAAQGQVLFSDNFERNNLAPWTTSNTQRAGIATGADFSNSPTRGGFTRYDPVTVTSPTINAAVPAAQVSFWFRRGSDAFSEDTDPGEDLVLEYRRADNTFGILRSYPGSGINGEQLNEVIVLPPDALHGNLALRFRQTAGSGIGFDWYHFDDVVVTQITPPPPIGVGQCEEFSSGIPNNWTTTTSGTASVGTSSATFLSPSASLFTNGGAATVATSTIDTSVPEFDNVSVWIRRGADSFSENPDGVEDFVIEYLDNASSWIVLETFAGSGSPGQQFNRTYAIPPAGRHANFQIRFRQTGGSGPAFDFWHADDLCINARPLPALNVAKITRTIWDPINTTTNPFAIPGSIAEYTISVTNEGAGTVDAGTILIEDILSANVELFVDTTSGDPIRFEDSATAPSGLSYLYSTAVTFSNQPGGAPPFDYVPTPDLTGFDPAITAVRIQPAGTMNGAVPGTNPSFQLIMQVRVR